MGREVMCEVRVGQRSFKTKVELEGDQILVRGPEGFRLRFDELTFYEAKAGVLTLTHPRRSVELVLGSDAAQWLEEIRSPRGRLEKLGVKPKTRVALMGRLPRDLTDEVYASGAVVVQGGAVDLVLLAVEERRDLAQLDTLKEWIAPSGAVWVIRTKGSEALVERDVWTAAKSAKLVDVKVAKLSQKLTGHMLVIPMAERKGTARASKVTGNPQAIIRKARGDREKKKEATRQGAAGRLKAKLKKKTPKGWA